MPKPKLGTHTPDPRLYGRAPVEWEASENGVWLTLAGLMKRLALSEATIRATPWLMALARYPSPRTPRWHVDDVDAGVKEHGKRPGERTLPRYDDMVHSPRAKRGRNAVREMMERKLAETPVPEIG